MKNFSTSLSGYCSEFLKFVEKEATFKNLLKFSLLLCPLFSLATDPGATPTTNFISKKANAPLGVTESIRTNLYLLMDDGSTILADGVYTEYNNLYHDSVTLEDAAKFTNILENIGLLRYGKTLAIEKRPIIQTNDTLFLKLWKTTQRHYQIEVVTNLVTNVGLQAFFEDSYLNTSTPLGLGEKTKINFSVNADPASASMYRFKITFKPKPLYIPTPVIFNSLNACQEGEKIAVKWKVENETDVAKYEVEKSTNGTEFSLVNTTLVNTNDHISGNYTWLDDKRVSGSNFYRIKTVTLSGSSKTTATVKVIASKKGASFIVYPNPVKDNTINLQLVDQAAGLYQVKLINISGQVVYNNKLSVSSNSMSQSLKVEKTLPKGIYQLEINNANNSRQLKTIMVQ